MTESVKPWGTPEIQPLLIRDHIGFTHMLAERFAGQATVVIAGFGEDPNQTDPKTGRPGKHVRPKVGHAVVGDVQKTLAELGKFVELPHYNAYMPLAIFRPDLPSGTKGSEQDVVASLGLVADFDDPGAASWAKRLPIPPNYVLETSAGRFQAFYFFDKPEVLEVVKPVAERLKRFAECDHGTSDISHVWRVPGALNWPNAKKVAEGRPRNAQFVRVEKAWDGERTSLQALSDLLPEGEAKPGRNDTTIQGSATGGQEVPKGKAHSPHSAAVEGTPENLDAVQRMLSLPADLQEQIKQPAAGDRSKALFRLIIRLMEQGLEDKAIENVIYAHPKGIGAKYADRDDLDSEIARVRAKTATRPVSQIRGGRLPWVIDEAEEHLLQSDHELFQRGSLIVRPVQESIPVTNGRQIAGTRLAQVRLHDMRETFSRVADFQKLDLRSNAWVSVDCPRAVAETYLEREGKWHLPLLTRIITAPTIRPDGSVLEEPGYDEATGLLFEPQGVIFPRVPPNPDIVDVHAAIGILLDLLKTFPFVDEPSRAVALSAILTSLVRPSLPSAPLHAFTAPIRGSGKSLLVDVASMISAGHETPVMAQGRTAEEFEKRLGAALIAGDGTISIDNCEQPLGGDLLCQVLTQPRVTIRILGQSKKVNVLTNATLFATGNNLRVVGDSTRRAIVCSLDPQCERPELRKFSIDVLELIRRDRPRYVAAALTILRYASSAELPNWCTPETLGSFEKWSRWVRAAVIFTTDADPCATMERAQAQEPELERLANVIHQWSSAIGDRPVTTSEVIEVATKQQTPVADLGSRRFVHDALREALLVVAGNSGNIDSRRLGMWLGGIKDRIVGGRKITSTTMSSGSNRWLLVHVGDSRIRSGEEPPSSPPTPDSRAA